MLRHLRDLGRVLLAVSVLGTTFASGSKAQSADTSRTARAADTTSTRALGAFIDGYYAWDGNRPPNFDRSFTTQPARHAEFNVNLAYVDYKLKAARYRGRLALQFGTSVQSNYAAEPRLGGISGPSVSQFLQEATVGYQLRPTLWLDGGVFFAHVGYEGWISRDNLAYTRSLVADYSPYYETGAKLTWTPSSTLSATFALVNGWQVVSNYNTPPAGGVRLDYVANDKLTLTYDNFIGNMAPDSADTRLRIYHDVIAQYNPSAKWQFAAVYSLGSQSHSASNAGTASWWGMSAFAKYHVSPDVAFVGRVERYVDPSQVVINTGLPDSFRTNGASMGVDVKLAGSVMWRSEARGLWSTSRVWPGHAVGTFENRNVFAVTSLAMSF